MRMVIIHLTCSSSSVITSVIQKDSMNTSRKFPHFEIQCSVEWEIGNSISKKCETGFLIVVLLKIQVITGY